MKIISPRAHGRRKDFEIFPRAKSGVQLASGNAYHPSALPTITYGRGAGVGRGRPTGLGLAVGEGLGVDVGVAVGVNVGVAVAVGVGVELAVGVGVGVPPVGPWIVAIIGEPVLKNPTVALELCGG